MKTKKFIKIDLYHICDLLAIITLIFLAVFLVNKTKLDYFLFFAGIACLTTSLQLHFGQAAIKNKSNKTLKAKTEDEDKEFLINVEPHSKVFQIDGIKVANKVYKIPDSIHVKVTKKNKVRVSSFCAYMIYWLYNGGILDVAPDEKWNKLFEA